MHYTGENWDLLRQQIDESNMLYRQECLDIIDNYTVGGGREGKLLRLANGSPYRYIKKHFLAKQRSASNIQVFYQISDTVSMAKIEEATLLVKENKYAEALATLDGIKMDLAMVDNLRGVCYTMIGDVESGRKYLQRSVDKGNEDAASNLRKLDEQQRKIEYK